MRPVIKLPINYAGRLVESSIRPEQIVAFIDRMFLGREFFDMSWNLRLSMRYAPQLAALLELVRLLPQKHTPSELPGYVEYLTSLVAIRHVMKEWQTQNSLELLECYPSLGDLHPLGLIRRALEEIVNTPNVAPVTIAEVEILSLQISAAMSAGSHDLIGLAPEKLTQTSERSLITKSIIVPRSFAQVNPPRSLLLVPEEVQLHVFDDLTSHDRSSLNKRTPKIQSNPKP
jgi:hypothetical protein